jgi:hypothetical protein
LRASCLNFSFSTLFQCLHFVTILSQNTRSTSNWQPTSKIFSIVSICGAPKWLYFFGPFYIVFICLTLLRKLIFKYIQIKLRNFKQFVAWGRSPSCCSRCCSVPTNILYIINILVLNNLSTNINISGTWPQYNSPAKYYIWGIKKITENWAFADEEANLYVCGVSGKISTLLFW